ncbi:hypothetical protein FNV62_03685 [Streptomyces sp. RLB3-17]|nr:hypothetical protein FNV64_07020 [Streptomyces sp. S1A1-7]QDN84997.1 hypothetical protein FNV61_04325 [Streptomyces sp. RLB3-6]QDO37431.1 hypothetical protein FNV62_03685 [Streptomyces sp. RLB3-17]
MVGVRGTSPQVRGAGHGQACRLGCRPGVPPGGGHRPRGAALGAGFHLHAHASPPRWADPPSETTSAMGSLS